MGDITHFLMMSPVLQNGPGPVHGSWWNPCPKACVYGDVAISFDFFKRNSPLSCWKQLLISEAANEEYEAGGTHILWFRAYLHRVPSPKSLEVNPCNLSRWEHGSLDLPLHTRSQNLMSKYDMDAYMATFLGGEAQDLWWELGRAKS